MPESYESITDFLRQELYALAVSLQDHDVPVVVGGGYGLLLRQRYLIEIGATTLRRMPPARSTEDLDLYLAAELVVDAVRIAALRDALNKMGYEPVPGALYYQFQREVDYFGQRRTVKVDLLAPLPTDEVRLSLLKYDSRRVRPRTVDRIHAHTSPEALTVGEHLLALVIEGDQGPVTVYTPHPYTYLLLKLHAYRDRLNDEASDFGRHHALDLYRTLAMITEPEWDQALSLGIHFGDTEPVQEAARIAHDLFRSETSKGMLAILERARTMGFGLPARDIRGFMSDLHELFPAPAP